MIQINTTTHTKGGLTIATGSVLNVTPHFMDYVDAKGKTRYNISFDVKIYKNMDGYLAKQVLTNDYMVEYNIGYQANDVDIQPSTPISSLLQLLQTAIEKGSEGYKGVGTGKTALVFPPTN